MGRTAFVGSHQIPFKVSKVANGCRDASEVFADLTPHAIDGDISAVLRLSQPTS
jgi:hypothetical protein